MLLGVTADFGGLLLVRACEEWLGRVSLELGTFHGWGGYCPGAVRGTARAGGRGRGAQGLEQALAAVTTFDGAALKMKK